MEKLHRSHGPAQSEGNVALAGDESLTQNPILTNEQAVAHLPPARTRLWVVLWGVIVFIVFWDLLNR